MNARDSLEKNKLRDRISEISTLALFTAAAAGISLLVMDILVFPVALFSVKLTGAFTLLMKILTILLIASAIIIPMVKKIRLFRKEGLGYKEIFQALSIAPLRQFSIFFFFLLLSAALLTFLIIILYYNYYLVYKIGSS